MNDQEIANQVQHVIAYLGETLLSMDWVAKQNEGGYCLMFKCYTDEYVSIGRFAMVTDADISTIRGVAEEQRRDALNVIAKRCYHEMFGFAWHSKQDFVMKQKYAINVRDELQEQANSLVSRIDWMERRIADLGVLIIEELGKEL